MRLDQLKPSFNHLPVNSDIVESSYNPIAMGCGCFSSDESARTPFPTSVPSSKLPAIDPESLLRLGPVFCQVHNPRPDLASKYQSFLLISDRDLHQRTDLQRSVYIHQAREPICPIDIREKEENVVISLCLENAAELRQTLHAAFETMGRRVKGNALVEFMRNSLGEESLFESENVLFFAEEFVLFCLHLKQKSRFDIVTDCANLSRMLRLEACKHSTPSLW